MSVCLGEREREREREDMITLHRNKETEAKEQRKAQETCRIRYRGYCFGHKQCSLNMIRIEVKEMVWTVLKRAEKILCYREKKKL